MNLGNCPGCGQPLSVKYEKYRGWFIECGSGWQLTFLHKMRKQAILDYINNHRIG